MEDLIKATSVLILTSNSGFSSAGRQEHNFIILEKSKTCSCSENFFLKKSGGKIQNFGEKDWKNISKIFKFLNLMGGNIKS